MMEGELFTDEDIRRIAEGRKFEDVKKNIEDSLTSLDAYWREHPLANIKVRWINPDGTPHVWIMSIRYLIDELEDLRTIQSERDPRYNKALNFLGYRIEDDGEDKLRSRTFE